METIATEQRRLYSATEKTMLLEAYKNSGQIAKQWCTENNIGLSTLQRWLKNDRKQTNTQPVQSWVPVVAAKEEKSDVLTIQIGNFNISVAKNTDIELLSTVLKVMRQVC